MHPAWKQFTLIIVSPAIYKELQRRRVAVTVKFGISKISDAICLLTGHSQIAWTLPAFKCPSRAAYSLGTRREHKLISK